MALDNGTPPTADSLIVVTPIGADATRAIVASDLDPSRTVGIDALFLGKGAAVCSPTQVSPTSGANPPARPSPSDGVVVYLVRDSSG